MRLLPNRTAVVLATRVAVFVALVLVAVVEYHAWFLRGGGALRIVGAGVLAGAAGALRAVRALRVAYVAISLAGLAAFLAWVVYSSAALPSGSVLHAVWSGVLHGAPRMWTTSVPADVRPELLTVPVVVTWVCGTAAGAVGVGHRLPVWGVLPGLVAFLSSLLLTERGSTFDALATTVWIVLAAVALALPSNRGAAGTNPVARVGSRGTGVVVAAASSVLVVGLAALVVIATPLGRSDRRFDPRRYVTAPVHLTTDVSPLSLVDGQLSRRDGKTAKIMTVRIDGAQPVDARVRVAALDQFDGALWTVGGTLQRAGSQLPVLVGSVSRRSSTSIEIRQPRTNPFGPFVPTVGTPTGISGPSAWIQPGTGQLVTTATGATDFTIDTTVRQFSAVDVRQASTDPAFGHQVAYPVPPTIVALANDVAAKSQTVVGRLADIRDRVRSLSYSTSTPSGHSYFALAEFLRRKAGNVEQHVALAVVLARLLGIPARVAVGYRLIPQQRRGTTYTVTPNDAYAWMEVPYIGLGWVSYDPAKPTDPRKVPPPPTKSITSRNSQDGGNGGTQIVVTPPAPPRAASFTLFTWPVVVALVLVAIISVAALARLAVRRRRRMHGSPARRIVAAWISVRDVLADARLIVPASATINEAAALAATRFDAALGRRVEALAPVVAVALYAPAAPGDKDAVRAWQLERDVRSAWHARQSLVSRTIAAVDPRWVGRAVAQTVRDAVRRRRAARR